MIKYANFHFDNFIRKFLAAIVLLIASFPYLCLPSFFLWLLAGTSFSCFAHLSELHATLLFIVCHLLVVWAFNVFPDDIFGDEFAEYEKQIL